MGPMAFLSGFEKRAACKQLRKCANDKTKTLSKTILAETAKNTPTKLKFEALLNKHCNNLIAINQKFLNKKIYLLFICEEQLIVNFVKNAIIIIIYFFDHI